MLATFFVCALSVGVDAKPFKPTAVFSGTHSQIKKERFVQVLAADGWKKLWEEHRGKDSKFTESFQEFEIDFETHYLIAIFTAGSADWCSLVPRIRDKEVVIGFKREYHQTEGGPLGQGGKPTTPEEIEREKKEKTVAPYAFIVLPRSTRSVAIEQNVQTTLGDPPIWKHRTRFTLEAK